MSDPRYLPGECRRVAVDARTRPTVADATFGNARNRLQRLQTCECHSLPVVEDRRVVGILMMETLGEFSVGMLR